MENAIRALVILLPMILGYLGLVVVLGGVGWFLYRRGGSSASGAVALRGGGSKLKSRPEASPSPSPSPSPKPDEVGKAREEKIWHGVETSDSEVEDELQQKGLGMLLNGKHQELDEWLGQIDEQLLPHGSWSLAVFYQALGHYHERPDFEPEGSYKTLIEAAQAWKAAVPQSRFAPVGLANAHLGLAWFMAYDEKGWARQKYGDDLVKHFSEEINRANASFEGSSEDLWGNPHFYATMLVMALVTDMPSENVAEYFEQGKECRQEYISLYIFTAQWHLPRWHGKSGKDWVQWLEQAVSSLPEEQADMMYARVALKLIGLMFYHEQHNPFTEDDLNWDRVREGGYLALEKLPASTQLPSTLLMAAHLANDPQTANKLISRMNGRADLEYWPSAEHLDAVTRWARDEAKDQAQ